MITEPPDFIGNVLAKMISRALANPDLARRVQNWKMIIKLSSDFYPVSIVFDKGVSVIRALDTIPTINVHLRFETVIHLIEGKASMIGEILKRRIRVEGFLRHPIATFRFYKLMQALLEV